MPVNNGMSPDYGFNVPDQNQSPAPPSYAFQSPPMQTYRPNTPRNEGFGEGSQFATQLLAQPLVQNVAMTYGNALANQGKQQFEKYVPVTALRYYFAVDTDYVIMKLMLLFFPFTHKVSKQ